MPLCSAGSAHEYLGWNLTAIVTSVQNGDNSPSTAPGIEYLGTVGQRGAAVAADERGHIVHVRFRRHGLHWLQGLTSSPQRPDCVAGVVGLELRNVVANYPFERSRRFPESSRILATETIPA